MIGTAKVLNLPEFVIAIYCVYLKYCKFQSTCAPKYRVFQIYKINGNNKLIWYKLWRDFFSTSSISSVVLKLWEDGCFMLDFRCDSLKKGPLCSLRVNNTQKCPGFFQLFAQGGGGQNEIVWGKYVSMCKACGKLRGSEGMRPREILDLLLDAIWVNLGLFLHKQFTILSLKLL